MFQKRKAIILEYFACPAYIAIQFLLDDEDTVRVVSEAIWDFGYVSKLARDIVCFNNAYNGETTLDILERTQKDKLVFPVRQSTENPKLILVDIKKGDN